jgi:hypothetical protein
MTPSAFIKKGKASNLKERSAAHEHFIDLCRLLDEAVAQAYAWKSDISDDDMLTKLLALNLERAFVIVVILIIVFLLRRRRI